MPGEYNENLANLISLVGEKDKDQNKKLEPEELKNAQDFEAYRRNVYALRNCYFGGDKKSFLDAVEATLKTDLTCQRLKITIKDVMQWLDIPYESFSEKVKRAKIELAQNGITSEQREGYGVLSNQLYLRVNPFGKERSKDTYDFNQKFKNFLFFSAENKAEREITKREFLGRDDAWRLYLGLPQQHNTFGISDYQPTRRTDNDKYYYKLLPEVEKKILELAFYTDWQTPIQEKILSLEKQITQKSEENARIESNIKKKPHSERSSLDESVLFFNRRDLKELESELDEQKRTVKNNYAFHMEDDFHKGKDSTPFAGVMGDFTISYGNDSKGFYISYYDLWDLKPSVFGEKIDASTIAGKAFEIYNRIYYDPKTGKRVN